MPSHLSFTPWLAYGFVGFVHVSHLCLSFMYLFFSRFFLDSDFYLYTGVEKMVASTVIGWDWCRLGFYYILSNSVLIITRYYDTVMLKALHLFRLSEEWQDQTAPRGIWILIDSTLSLRISDICITIFLPFSQYLRFKYKCHHHVRLVNVVNVICIELGIK